LHLRFSSGCKYHQLKRYCPVQVAQEVSALWGTAALATALLRDDTL